MVFDLTASLGTFKALFDAAKGLKDISDAATRNAAVVELQEKILTAQSQQASLIERIGQLEKEMARFETWDREKERYVLADFGCGTLACVLKGGMENGEPPHRICAQCYQDGRKGYLQSHGMFHGREKVTCQACNKTFMLGCESSSRQTHANRDPDYF